MYSDLKLKRGQLVKFKMTKDGDYFVGTVSFDPNRYITNFSGDKISIVWVFDSNENEICVDKRNITVI